jgi:hypothetical protein
MSLEGIRAAIDSAPHGDRAAAARQIRNAIARAVLDEALSHEQVGPPSHPPPATALRERVGPDLADGLLRVYAGDPDWTTHALDALEPLHQIARGE